MDKSNDLFDETNVIFEYTREEAIDDGFLVPVGRIGNQSVVFTTNLFSEGYEDKDKRIELIKKGLRLLRQPDPEDTDYMKLRVIEKNRIWLIWNGEGFTFMKPEDY